MPPRADFKWKPIERWNGPWPASPLAEVYQAFEKHLDPNSLEAHRQRTAREWSIETGQIEGAFDIDQAASTALIGKGFDASRIPVQRNGLSQERVHAILQDTKAALDGLFEFVQGDRPLTPHFVRTLHQQLMNNIDTRDVHVKDPATGQIRAEQRPLRKGEYKKEPNNPTREDGGAHEYCPPVAVEAEMDRLFTLFHQMESEAAPPEVLAAWLHYSFAKIHPFEDGNGRVARALATIVLIQAGLPPFTVIRDMRPRYIEALEAADKGDRQPLLDFFESALYRQTFLLCTEVRRKPPPDTSFGQFPAATDHLTRLQSFTIGRLARLRATIVSTAVASEPFIAPLTNDRAAAHVTATERWGDTAVDLIPERCSAEFLALSASSIISILFHRLHESPPRLAAVTATLTQNGTIQVIGRPFFVTVQTPDDTFDQWLDRNLTEALHLWQQTH
jgi:Fic family protein